MKNTKLPLVLPILLLTLAVPQVWAQEEGSQILLVSQYKVKPSKLSDFEAGVQKLGAVYEPGEGSPRSIAGMASDNFVYTMVTPVESAGDVVRVAGDVWQAIGKMGGDAANKLGESIEYSSQFLVLHRPSLSYTPEKPRLEPGEVGYIRFDFHYLELTGMTQAADVARDYAALFEEKGITDGFDYYSVLSGDELPLVIIASYGKDAIDHATQQQKIGEKLGEEGQALDAKRLSIVRRYEEIGARMLMGASND